ncbi:MAG: hypothetical protein Kow0074_16860 [Candidatus Zixiibacteriota bacterium]
MERKLIKVTPSTLIEDLVTAIPDAVTYLGQHGIRCIRCGEPIWGTIAEAAREKGYGDEDIQRFVDDLNALAKSHR